MFEAALIEAVKRLEQLKSQGKLSSFALIGGFAVARWGVPRATADIDFAVAVGNSPIEDTANTLGGVYRKGTMGDPLLGAISFSIPDAIAPIPVQLIVLPPAWENVAFTEVQELAIGSLVVPIVDWKALVLLKLYAAGPLDLADAEGIIQAVNPNEKELQSLRRTASSLRVSRRLSKIIG